LQPCRGLRIRIAGRFGRQMRKRLKKKKLKMFLESMRPTGDPGFERFSRALCKVVAAELDVPVDMLTAPPPWIPPRKRLAPLFAPILDGDLGSARRVAAIKAPAMYNEQMN
jgi:hypothetical protein